MGSLFEILSESTPILEDVCNWKSSESNYHKQLIKSNQQQQISDNATKTLKNIKFGLQFL